MGMEPGGKPPDQPLEPVTIAVKGTRVGNSVLLDITGTGGRRPASHPMERAENWTIRVLAGDVELERKVNGSVKVERYQVGNPAWGLWDIEVRFSAAFAVPEDAEEITVQVRAPESDVHEEILHIGLDPASTPATAKPPAGQQSRRKSSRQPNDKTNKKSGKKSGKKSRSPK